MIYITSVHALNLNCSLETTGDWHQSAMQWERPHTKDTNTAFYGDYGIEQNSYVPEHRGTFYVANHIRACLDMLYDQDYSNLQGMNEDYIGIDKYNEEIFAKVYQMRRLPYWGNINNFMGKEYKDKWITFLKAKGDTILPVETDFRKLVMEIKQDGK